MAGKPQREQIALAGAVSKPIIFTRRMDEATVKLRPGIGGSAVVQFTCDAAELVDANPDAADWEDWEPGIVNGTTSRALAGPVTAVRCSAIAAAAILQVVANFDH